MRRLGAEGSSLERRRECLGVEKERKKKKEKNAKRQKEGKQKHKPQNRRRTTTTARRRRSTSEKKKTMTQADTFSPVTDYRSNTEVVDVPHGDFSTAPYIDNNGSSELIYKTKPRYDTIFVVILAGIPFVLLALGTGFFFVTWYVSVVLYIEAFALVLVLSLVLPRNIEIYSDRFVIKTNTFSATTMLADITEVSTIENVGTTRACKFTTSFSGRVIVRRRNAQDLIFCPMYPSEFVSFLKYACCPSMFSRPTLQHESWTAPPLMV